MIIGSHESRVWAVRLFERLAARMVEGELQIVFHRGGASLLWKTDGGSGYELGLSVPPDFSEVGEEALVKYAEFLRGGDLKSRPDGENVGLVDTGGIVRAAIAGVHAFDTKDVWYRGQPSSSMKLVPGVFRNSVIAERESSMLFRFITGARSRYEKCPEDNDQASWLTLMQHYGLPTRLLDWSESVLVAAYFAVENDSFDAEPGTIWAINPGRLNEVMLGIKRQICYLRSKEAQSLVESAFAPGLAHTDRVAAVSGPELDPRLLLQYGRFTLHGSPSPLESTPNKNEFLRRITIPPFAKARIREELSYLGIRESTLFPDLRTLARDISKSYSAVRKTAT